jgi:hypothetical protein
MFRENGFEAPTEFEKEKAGIEEGGAKSTDMTDVVAEAEDTIASSEGESKSRLENALEQLRKMRE